MLAACNPGILTKPTERSKDMNISEQVIIEDTGCPPEEAYKVETLMRSDVFRSTLDGPSRAEFRRGGRARPSGC